LCLDPAPVAVPSGLASVVASMSLPANPSQPLRLVYCTSGGLYGRLVLAWLRASPGIEVAGVVLSTRVLRKDYGWLQGAMRQLELSGPRYALYLWAATGLADTLAPRASVESQATVDGVPLLATRDINGSEGADFLAASRPDLLLSGFFNQRIGESACATAPLGAVNIHPGALPDFKGVDPVLRALLDGRDRLGVTLHRVTPAFDEGPVLAADSLAVARGESLLALTARLFCRGADLFAGSLDRLVGKAPGEAQDGTGRYDSWPGAGDVAALRARGHPLVGRADIARLRAAKGCADWPAGAVSGRFRR
jgi:methionyl-tRNA formyltransferase